MVKFVIVILVLPLFTVSGSLRYRRNTSFTVRPGYCGIWSIRPPLARPLSMSPLATLMCLIRSKVLDTGFTCARVNVLKFSRRRRGILILAANMVVRTTCRRTRIMLLRIRIAVNPPRFLYPLISISLPIIAASALTLLIIRMLISIPYSLLAMLKMWLRVMWTLTSTSACATLRLPRGIGVRPRLVARTSMAASVKVRRGGWYTSRLVTLVSVMWNFVWYIIRLRRSVTRLPLNKNSFIRITTSV